MDGQPVVATTEGSSVVINGEAVPVTFEEDKGNDDKVNGEEVIPASEEGVTKISDVEAHTPAVTYTCINDKVIKVTIVVDNNGSVGTKKGNTAEKKQNKNKIWTDRSKNKKDETRNIKTIIDLIQYHHKYQRSGYYIYPQFRK